MHQEFYCKYSSSISSFLGLKPYLDDVFEQITAGRQIIPVQNKPLTCSEANIKEASYGLQ